MSQPSLPRVLCVDDEPNLLAGLAHTLRRRFAVTTAQSGLDALGEMQRSAAFDVVVSDYRMPAMDGAEFLRRARELSPATVPVLLTGHATLDGAIAAVNQGNVFRILLKPCPPEILVAAIDEAVARGRVAPEERQRLSEAIDGLSGELQEAARLAIAGRPASGVGHEINNMVAVLDGTISGIKDSAESGAPLDPEDVAALAHVRRHLFTHGKNLMRLGRPPTSQVAVAELGRCIQEAISMLRDTGPLKRANVVVLVPPEPVRVAVGEIPLEQVLLNLVKNAADAVKDVRDRIPTIRVAVTVERAAGTAACAVEDDGVGIPPERMTLLFEPYHTTKEPGKGTGLGLFVVRHIVDSAGGRIAAESRAGQGSTFTFTLPLANEG